MTPLASLHRRAVFSTSFHGSRRADLGPGASPNLHFGRRKVLGTRFCWQNGTSFRGRQLTVFSCGGTALPPCAAAEAVEAHGRVARPSYDNVRDTRATGPVPGWCEDVFARDVRSYDAVYIADLCQYV